MFFFAGRQHPFSSVTPLPSTHPRRGKNENQQSQDLQKPDSKHKSIVVLTKKKLPACTGIPGGLGPCRSGDGVGGAPRHDLRLRGPRDAQPLAVLPARSDRLGPHVYTSRSARHRRSTAGGLQVRPERRLPEVRTGRRDPAGVVMVARMVRGLVVVGGDGDGDGGGGRVRGFCEERDDLSVTHGTCTAYAIETGKQKKILPSSRSFCWQKNTLS